MSDALTRFHRRYVVSPTGCWLWTGKLDRHGYGLGQRYMGKQFTPHRLAFVMFVGPIPDGAHVDHLCFVRHCVNPKHLEAVTYTENNRRMRIAVSPLGRQTCKYGHDWNVHPPKVTHPPSAKQVVRRCTECARLRPKKRRTIPETFKHGRAAYVNYGCKCPVCRRAVNEYSRSRYQPKKGMTDAV